MDDRGVQSKLSRSRSDDEESMVENSMESDRTPSPSVLGGLELLERSKCGHSAVLLDGGCQERESDATTDGLESTSYQRPSITCQYASPGAHHSVFKPIPIHHRSPVFTPPRKMFKPMDCRYSLGEPGSLFDYMLDLGDHESSGCRNDLPMGVMEDTSRIGISPVTVQPDVYSSQALFSSTQGSHLSQGSETLENPNLPLFDDEPATKPPPQVADRRQGSYPQQSQFIEGDGFSLTQLAMSTGESPKGGISPSDLTPSLKGSLRKTANADDATQKGTSSSPPDVSCSSLALESYNKSPQPEAPNAVSDLPEEDEINFSQSLKAITQNFLHSLKTRAVQEIERGPGESKKTSNGDELPASGENLVARKAISTPIPGSLQPVSVKPMRRMFPVFSSKTGKRDKDSRRGEDEVNSSLEIQSTKEILETGRSDSHKNSQVSRKSPSALEGRKTTGVSQKQKRFAKKVTLGMRRPQHVTPLEDSYGRLAGVTGDNSAGPTLPVTVSKVTAGATSGPTEMAEEDSPRIVPTAPFESSEGLRPEEDPPGDCRAAQLNSSNGPEGDPVISTAAPIPATPHPSQDSAEKLTSLDDLEREYGELERELIQGTTATSSRLQELQDSIISLKGKLKEEAKAVQAKRNSIVDHGSGHLSREEKNQQLLKLSEQQIQILSILGVHKKLASALSETIHGNETQITGDHVTGMPTGHSSFGQATTSANQTGNAQKATALVRPSEDRSANCKNPFVQRPTDHEQPGGNNRCSGFPDTSSVIEGQGAVIGERIVSQNASDIYAPCGTGTGRGVPPVRDAAVKVGEFYHASKCAAGAPAYPAKLVLWGGDASTGTIGHTATQISYTSCENRGGNDNPTSQQMNMFVIPSLSRTGGPGQAPEPTKVQYAIQAGEVQDSQSVALGVCQSSVLDTNGRSLDQPVDQQSLNDESTSAYQTTPPGTSYSLTLKDMIDNKVIDPENKDCLSFRGRDGLVYGTLTKDGSVMCDTTWHRSEREWYSEYYNFPVTTIRRSKLWNIILYKGVQLNNLACQCQMICIAKKLKGPTQPDVVTKFMRPPEPPVRVQEHSSPSDEARLPIGGTEPRLFDTFDPCRIKAVYLIGEDELFREDDLILNGFWEKDEKFDSLVPQSWITDLTSW